MRTKIVGILNITPDSFSDGGKYNSHETALNHLMQLIAEGADMIDVGAESTRPSAQRISVTEELKRLENILPEIIIIAHGKKIPVSIDTMNYETAKKALELGVDIINDVSGLEDLRIVDLIAQNRGVKTILMHCKTIDPNPEIIIDKALNIDKKIINWAEEKIAFLLKNGVKKSQIIFDPGIGFNKNAEQSIRLIRNIDSFRSLDLPIYVGHSKKSFLDQINLQNKDRAEKTLIISKFLAQKMVDFIRVHDVLANKNAILN